MTMFTNFALKGPQKRPHISARRQKFEKAYALFQFCVWTGAWADEITPHVDTRKASIKYLKTVPKRSKTALFLVLLLRLYSF